MRTQTLSTHKLANKTYSLKVRSIGQVRSSGNAMMAARWLGVQWDAICAMVQLKPTTSKLISNKQGAKPMHAHKPVGVRLTCAPSATLSAMLPSLVPSSHR